MLLLLLPYDVDGRGDVALTLALAVPALLAILVDRWLRRPGRRRD